MLEYVAISKKNCVANLRILQVKTDEEIRILRRFDKSQMDMSAAQTCLTTFAQRRVLFVQKTATSSGYTQHASSREARDKFSELQRLDLTARC